MNDRFPRMNAYTFYNHAHGGPPLLLRYRVELFHYRENCLFMDLPHNLNAFPALNRYNDARSDP